MNDKKRSIGIVMVAAIASLLLAGTILAPTQASALSKFNNKTDTASLKHAVRDGVSVNLEHRSQHMDQENLCYRADTCRQSNVGQNTLGNDNSITGFADQSDNIPQAAAPITSNQTTGNQTSGGGGGGTPVTPPACTVGVSATLNTTGAAVCVTLAAGTIVPPAGGCVSPLVAVRIDGVTVCGTVVATL